MDEATPKIEVYLTSGNAEKAVEFYGRAFGATEAFRMMADDGKRILHCTLAVFGSQIMLSDTFEEFNTHTAGPSPDKPGHMTIHVNFAAPAELDQAYAKALSEGAIGTMEPEDTFWEARYARLRDLEGHNWAFMSPPASPKS